MEKSKGYFSKDEVETGDSDMKKIMTFLSTREMNLKL